MNKFTHWLHHLFDPHCHDCQILEEEQRVCQSCETLKMQLSIANIEKKQLLESILSFTKPAAIETVHITPEDVKPKMMTWNIRKRMLEEEDRRTAALMKDKERVNKEISDLEKELGIPEKEAEDVTSI